MIADFSSATNNSKLRKVAEHLGIPYSHIVTWSLPAGYTCPAASECKAWANRKTGEITDAPGMRYRCYAASIEARYKNVRAKLWENYDLMRSISGTPSHQATSMADALYDMLPKSAEVVRIHVHGDFFSISYFNAWILLARRCPDVIFYGYTKRAKYLQTFGCHMPSNLRLAVSAGGLEDGYALEKPRVHVVDNQSEADLLGLPMVDGADSELLLMQGKGFALQIHGTQPVEIGKRLRG